MRAVTRSYSVKSNLKINPVLDLVATKTLQVSLNGDDFATVNYQVLNGDKYDLTHTSIPEKYQGQGLGSIFAERIFDYLASNNKKFKLTCEFLQKMHVQNGKKYENHVIDP